MYSLLGINRNTAEAKAKQEAWAREQMELEMPSTTLDGASIDDRADFVAKYIVSEREKFGRELSVAEAEAEIDAWLLKQASQPKTNAGDIGVGALVFLAAFGIGTYFAIQNSATQ